MKNLKTLKRMYWDITPSDKEVEQSWEQLKDRLTPPRRLSLSFLRYGAASFSLLIVFLAGTVGLAQAADPGTPLYSVKVLSDKIVSKVSGKPEILVKKRGQDLIEVSGSKPAKVEEANKEYNKALNNAEKEVKKNENKKEQVNNALDKQEKLFKKEIKENPKSENGLEKALEKTQNAREKIQGLKGKGNSRKN